MEKFKAPISFKIIFILNEIIFWLFNLVCLFGLVFIILVIAGVFKEDMQLHVNLPVAFNTQEIGYLTVNNTPTNVQLVEAYGSIHLIDTPLYLTRLFMIPLSMILAAMYFMLYTFRRFIRNMKKGIIFEAGNIKLLRILALSMLIFWQLWKTYDWLVGVWFEHRLNFGTIEITRETEGHIVLLICSLVLWVMSHVFSRGLILQEDQSLTI
ncbi:MAG: DUF2975 domain-containing protein [Marinilabiliaceae bacterium]|jgi:hypothetical protein|nr:DUF2975 domain-containing protein [Marinilabiliaceae bacterium]